MPAVVIDANITIAWMFDENDGKRCLEPVLLSSQLMAPSLWLLEVTNTILVSERRKRITQAQGTGLLAVIDGLSVELKPSPPTQTAMAIAQLARPHQLSSYDAAYLDVAIRYSLPLFTRDNNLRIAAARVGVVLVPEAAP